MYIMASTVLLPRGKFFFGECLDYNTAQSLVALCTLQKQNYCLQLLKRGLYLYQMSITFLGDRITTEFHLSNLHLYTYIDAIPEQKLIKYAIR
jgi:hypothetical protein